MIRTVLVYALLLALAVGGLQWIEYRHFTRTFPTEFYSVLLAVAFASLGFWAGSRFTRARPRREFGRNDAAIRSLGLTPRECEILSLLASDRSLKELARDLGISPNTVKTHVTRLYEKLNVQRRMQAIELARQLSIIP